MRTAFDAAWTAGAGDFFERTGALLARGRRFRVARRAEEAVRLAILLIGNGRYDASRRDAIHHKVVEGRSLLLRRGTSGRLGQCRDLGRLPP